MKEKVVAFGEIMLRLSPSGYRRFSQADSFDLVYGGGEANVCVSLANYGINTDFVTRLPQNDLGNSVLMNLRKHDVGVNYVLRGGDRLGIYFLEKGAVNRASKVIYDRANSAFSQIEPGMIDWDKVFKDATWFHWTGITPAISEGAALACKEALEAAHKKGIMISVDLNYRNKLWKYGRAPVEIMADLVKYCDIIVGNEEDAEKIFDIRAKGVEVTHGKVSAGAYESVAKQLAQRFPKARKIVFTLRGSVNASHNTWSGVLWDGKNLYKAHEYQITHIVDRVGTGDAFAGGLIYGLLAYKDDKKALDFAVAASALKHTVEGDFNLVAVSEVVKLMEGDASGRVSR